MFRVRRMADADMAIGIDDVLVREDTVGDHQIAQGLIKLAHDAPLNAKVAAVYFPTSPDAEISARPISRQRAMHRQSDLNRDAGQLLEPGRSSGLRPPGPRGADQARHEASVRSSRPDPPGPPPRASSARAGFGRGPSQSAHWLGDERGPTRISNGHRWPPLIP